MSATDYSNVRALTFDCYGTLIDWESGILAVLRPWARRESIGAATDDALLGAYSQIEPAVQTDSPTLAYGDILREVMRRIADQFDAVATHDDCEILAASVGDWPAFADSPEALVRLKSRFKLVIVSNVDRVSFARTNKRLGVAFDAIVTADDVGAYKPDPAHFHRALGLLEKDEGTDKGQIVHVAESLFHDHVPAKALGLRTVWINRRAGRPGSRATRAPDVAVQPDETYSTLAAFADRAVR